jgi:hypothetical protein
MKERQKSENERKLKEIKQEINKRVGMKLGQKM